MYQFNMGGPLSFKIGKMWSLERDDLVSVWEVRLLRPTKIPGFLSSSSDYSIGGSRFLKQHFHIFRPVDLTSYENLSKRYPLCAAE